MSTDRRMRLWGVVVRHACGAPVTVEHVCSALLVESGMDGAAVTVTAGDRLRETLYASDQTAADLAELSLTFGEGPSLEGSAGHLVLVGDLADADSSARWPVLAPAAVARGVRAVCALPLQVGGVRVGVVDLYRGRPDRLSSGQVDDGLILADMACALLIDGAADTSTDLDDGGPELARLQHPEVHQATGMIIAQLGVSAAVALLRLRAYAYANDRRLRDVARDVVARRLRFHREDGDGAG